MNRRSPLTFIVLVFLFGIAANPVCAGRIIALGDLHGDLNATRQALHLAGAIDESDHWVGGPS